MSSAKKTQDHAFIQKWVEDRGGIPTIVDDTGGLLRVDFVEGDARDERLEPTTWKRWFEIFDDRGLTFLYDPDADSRFFKLVYPESGD